MGFSFEKLEVYKKSLRWVEETETLVSEKNPKISRAMQDQLSRAALSISLNIAEGNGRWHKAEKRQLFWVARGSTFECVAIIQVLARIGCLESSRYRSYYGLLEEIGKMLSALIHSTEKLEQIYKAGAS